MEHYFITTHNVQPKNKKASAAVEFCSRYKHTLAVGRISYDAILAEIQLFCTQLNNTFPNGRAFVVRSSAYSDRPTYGTEHITVQFDGEVHNNIFQLCFTKVEKLFQFSELVPVTNFSQLEVE